MTMEIIDQTQAFPLSDTPPRTSPPRFIVIHYSLTHSPLQTVNVLRGKNLSTHFEVDQQGRIHQYVDPALRYTLHGLKLNKHSIGIDMTSMGKFSAAQIAGARRLVTYLCRRFNIPQVVAPDKVRYTTMAQIESAGLGILRHRNLRPTSCPGNFPIAVLADPLSDRLAGWQIAGLATAAILAAWLITKDRR